MALVHLPVARVLRVPPVRARVQRRAEARDAVEAADERGDEHVLPRVRVRRRRPQQVVRAEPGQQGAERHRLAVVESGGRRRRGSAGRTNILIILRASTRARASWKGGLGRERGAGRSEISYLRYVLPGVWWPTRVVHVRLVEIGDERADGVKGVAQQDERAAGRDERRRHDEEEDDGDGPSLCYMVQFEVDVTDHGPSSMRDCGRNGLAVFIFTWPARSDRLSREVDRLLKVSLDRRGGVAEVRDTDSGITAAGRVDLEGVDDPVGIGERAGVVGDVVVAGVGERRAGCVLAPDSTSVVTAEGVVEQDGEAVEVRGDIAAALELGDGGTPAGRVGAAVGDVRWDGVAAEEPDSDGVAVVINLGGVNTALVGVETSSVGRGVTRANCATLVGGLAGSVDIAVGGDDVAGEGAVVGDCAAGAVGGQHPESGPGAANATRHVANVDDDDSGAVRRLAGDTDRGTSIGGRVVVVNTDVGVGAIGAGVTSSAGGIRALVLNETVGGIIAGEEVKVVEEVAREEVRLEDELSQAGAAHEHKARSEGGEMHRRRIKWQDIYLNGRRTSSYTLCKTCRFEQHNFSAMASKPADRFDPRDHKPHRRNVSAACSSPSRRSTIRGASAEQRSSVVCRMLGLYTRTSSSCLEPHTVSAVVAPRFHIAAMKRKWAIRDISLRPAVSCLRL
nr:hypothetical protein CFP56_29913 [Quercus suber]